ncbi:glycosyltransferase [Paenibacillus beijingensis]|uniref:Glycosyl transferase family 2 n=1 Tax=Paenibacillus beijingensis TaxID=1126833 RepID=A0A0D5NEZ9_9BACL|nr:glycosyltransferase family 2 protein [Paenibacillus beijingensis]AJY73964.1 hypothetical protein VN24_04215 [Paenibacillus beijingensis]
MEISVVIPTFNEGRNVNILAERLTSVLSPLGRMFEIIFVDDSMDDTPNYLQKLTAGNPSVRYIHRTERRGLATAVLDGVDAAVGEIVVVMDADLQHPPEVIPDMIRTIEQGCQMVIPSRFIPGGNDGGLNPYRKVVSWGARMIARAALRRIRQISDPTSGFFAVRKAAIEGIRFEPLGWKIMLEFIVRADIRSIAEIPYRFQARDLGSSKMNMGEHLRYLVHVGKLVAASDEDSRFVKFGLIGLCGVVVNTTLYWTLLKSGLAVFWAFLAASFISMLFNFVLNNRYTWQSRHGSGSSILNWAGRLLKYSVVTSGSILLSSGLVSALVHFFHAHSLFSGWIGIAFGIVWNFVLNDKWTFSRKRAARPALVESAKAEPRRMEL